MNCPATNCSICARRKSKPADKTKVGWTSILVTLLVVQAIALWAGWIPE